MAEVSLDVDALSGEEINYANLQRVASLPPSTTSIDLSNSGLIVVPEELFNFPHLTVRNGVQNTCLC